MSAPDRGLDRRLAGAIAACLLVPTAGLVGFWAAVRDRLPDQLVRQWGVDGIPTATLPPGPLLVVALLVPTLLTVALGAIAVSHRHPQLLRRILGGTAAGLPVLLSVTLADALRRHLDLTDPAATPPPGPDLAVAVLAAIAVGIGVGALARDDPAGPEVQQPPPAHAPRPAGDDATASWHGRNRTIPPGLRWLVAGVVVGLTALAAVTTWWLLLIPGFLAPAMLATVRFELHVDQRGVRVTILGGRRMLEVPLEQVVGADVERIDEPFWQFGGWGLRVDTAGRLGVVTRPGTALRVHRSDGREVLITVDDAWDAAATLNALIDQRLRRSPPSEEPPDR